MGKLTIMRGCSGSGKSTWARSQEEAIVVSRDDIRAALFGSADQDYYACPRMYLKMKEQVVTDVQNEAIVSGLHSSFHVIVDNTNAQIDFVDDLAELGYRAGAEVEVKVIDVPLEQALDRNFQRGWDGGRYVPEEVIKRQHAELQATLHYLPSSPKGFQCS